jgi:hypothetical protein
VPRDYRDDNARQYAARDNLEQHVGQAVGGVVVSPRQVSPTVLEKTNERPNPTSRDARVKPATAAATEAKPALTYRLSSVLELTGTGRRPS